MSFDAPLFQVSSSKLLARVVSMQSHVAYGHVGNAVATFVLQRLGCEVTPLHTVMYSSHLGYAGWRGDQVSPAALVELVEGLDAIGALKGQHALLSGFLATPAHGEVALSLRDRLGAEALCIVDPVMGDHGRLYVPESLVDFYRTRLPGKVDVLVPNVFELGLLTRRPIPDVLTAITALAELEEAYLSANGARSPLLVVKGVPHPDDPSHLYIVARMGGEDVIHRTRRIARQFAGAGDLFSATLSAHLLHGETVRRALRAAISMTSEILDMTASMRRDELALVSAQRTFDSSEHSRAHGVDDVDVAHL